MNLISKETVVLLRRGNEHLVSNKFIGVKLSQRLDYKTEV